MIHDLPVELLQLVYESLDARDRARFRIAMGKNSRVVYNDPAHDRALWTLARAIDVGWIPSLTTPILNFVRGCNLGDPTLETVERAFPGTLAVCQHASLPQKITDGTVTPRDLEHVEYLDIDVMRSIYASRPPVFDILMHSDKVRNRVVGMLEAFIFSVFNHENDDLIEHIKVSGGAYGFDFVRLSKRLVDNDHTLDTLTKRWNTTRILLKHVSLDDEQVKRVWVASLGHMNLSAVEEINRMRRGVRQLQDSV